MRRTWRRRAITIAIIWIGTVGLFAVASMRPRPIPLAGIAVAIGMLVYLLLDLADVAEAGSWYAPRDASGTGRGADQRMRVLHRQLARPPGDDSARLHRLLVTLVDDRLLSEHGTDRALDPARAAQLLGPELTALVSGPPPRNLTQPAVLASVLTRIEAL